MKILVIRHDVFGDVFVVSCVCRGLKEKYPGCTVDFLCNVGYEIVIANNPYIDHIVREDDNSYDLVLPIDHANQWDDWMPRVHCRIAGVEFHAPEVYFSDAELQAAEQYKGVIALATTAGWKSRRYNHWAEVAQELAKRYRVVQVDNGLTVPGIEHPQLDVRQAMAVINAACLYLGIDSLPLHVAAATCTPAVVVMCATGAEIQYLPCSVILRTFPYKNWGDLRCVGGIDDIDPMIVVGEVIKKLSSPQAIVQYTDGDGNFVK